ncbi:MAG: GNAT family N-acetyltransferase [Bacteroidales bacterium]
MDNPKLRIANLQDIKYLTELLGLLFMQEKEFKPDTQKQSKGIELILQNPVRGHILVAELEHEIVAMVNLLYLISTALGSKVAILEDMVVKPGHRNKGYGGLLINYAIEFAKSQNCKRITLLTDSDNEIAIRFYGSYGFIKSDMVPMRLLLT